MIKKIFTLFKLARKIAKSDIPNIVSKFQEPPIIIKLLFKILSFSFTKKKRIEESKNEGERFYHSHSLKEKLKKIRTKGKDYQFLLSQWVLLLSNSDNF